MIVNQDNIALQRSCGKEFCELGLKSLFNVKNRKKNTGQYTENYHLPNAYKN